MKCKDISKFIIDKLAGELSPRQANKLDKHIAACDACRKEFEAFNKAWNFANETLNKDTFVKKLSPARRSEIFGIAQNEEKRQKSSRRLTRLVEYLAVIAICFILAGMLLPTLSSSRGRARRLSIQNTKKQLGLGVAMGEAEKTTDRFDTEEDEVEDEGNESTVIAKSFWKIAPAKKTKRKSNELFSPTTSASSLKPTSDGKIRSREIQSVPASKQQLLCDSIMVSPKDKKIKQVKPLVISEARLKEKEFSFKKLAGVQNMRRMETKQDMNYDADVSSKGSGYISRGKRANSKSRMQACVVSPPMPQKTFKLNLKLWNMTTVSNVRKYLKEHKYPASVNIRVYKNQDKIIIQASKAQLEKISKLFKKLQEEEKELKDLRKGLPFIKCSSRPISTFSIDTDTASYVQARKSIRRGERPDPLKIRPEEFINYFDYNYRSPNNTTFAVYPEAAPSPFRPNNTLFRIGIQGKRLGPNANTRTHYTILLDTSGSMAVKDRMELAKKALAMLLKKLKASDYVSLLLCGSKTHVVFRMKALTPGNRQRLLRILNSVTPRSVADFANGISKAYSFADRYYLRNSSNRVIIISDGIFELDTAGRQNITTQIEAARKRGISNIVIGLGGDGDDSMLEKVAAIGDGSYVFLDTEREAKELFSTQFEVRFREIARDVKIQVEFNPDAVKSYRQIGYKNRQLSKADFRNDKVDAGEVGSGQAVTALYELKLKDKIPKDTIIATVRIRYKKVNDMSVEEKAFYLSESDIKEKFKTASANFKLAAFVSEFAESLRYPETQGIASLRGVADQLNGTWMKHYRKDHKVTELLSLIKRSK